MSDLERELFGSSDSEEGESYSQEKDGSEADPIYRSIMESHEDPSEDPTSSTISSCQLPRSPLHNRHPFIPGLTLHTHVLSDGNQARLMALITERNFFKRGQQNQAMCFGERDLAWLGWLHELMFEKGVLDEPHCSVDWTRRRPLFNQGIMNLYLPGDGIKPHVDLARFEDGLVIISLLSAINMDFYPAIHPMSPEDPPEGQTLSNTADVIAKQQARMPSFTVRLEPGSIVSMQGQARYTWEHGIRETTRDDVHGDWVQRKIRVSVTLRKMRETAWVVGGGEEGGEGTSSMDNGVADRR